MEDLKQNILDALYDATDSETNQVEIFYFIRLLDVILSDESKESIPIVDITNRLRDIPRFNLETYRAGDYDVETAREIEEYGDYIDSSEIEALIDYLSKLKA